jgi:DNA-binding NtrC family response regulator
MTTIAPTTGPVPIIGPASDAPFRPINEEIRELEKKRMVDALLAANGVKTKAAQLIDMPIRTFTLKLKQYKL